MIRVREHDERPTVQNCPKAFTIPAADLPKSIRAGQRFYLNGDDFKAFRHHESKSVCCWDVELGLYRILRVAKRGCVYIRAATQYGNEHRYLLKAEQVRRVRAWRAIARHAVASSAELSFMDSTLTCWWAKTPISEDAVRRLAKWMAKDIGYRRLSETKRALAGDSAPWPSRPGPLARSRLAAEFYTKMFLGSMQEPRLLRKEALPWK